MAAVRGGAHASGGVGGISRWFARIIPDSCSVQPSRTNVQAVYHRCGLATVTTILNGQTSEAPLRWPPYLAGGGRALAPGASAHQSSGKFIFFSRARYRGSPRRFRSSGSDFTCISPVSGNAYARSSHSNARSNSRLYAYTWAIW